MMTSPYWQFSESKGILLLDNCQPSLDLPPIIGPEVKSGSVALGGRLEWGAG